MGSNITASAVSKIVIFEVLRTSQVKKKILAPVAQGIEHWFPKPCAHVRVMPGAPNFFS